MLAGFLGREQEGVAFPLVVPLPMIMINRQVRVATRLDQTRPVSLSIPLLPIASIFPAYAFSLDFVPGVTWHTMRARVVLAQL